MIIGQVGMFMAVYSRDRGPSEGYGRILDAADNVNAMSVSGRAYEKRNGGISLW